MIDELRAWFSGRTGPCQGSDGSPILPARTPKSFIQYKFAPMVKWISQRSSEPLLWVRVLLGAQKTESF